MGGGMGGGMGGMGAVRASVKPSGMPSLFSQPDAPRVDASAFSAPATLEDAATVRAAGGLREDCGSAACARVRLERLREANERLMLPNGTVTAGAIGGRNCHDFDESACPGQANATISLAELVPYSEDEQIVIMDLPDMTKGEHALLTALSASYEPPEFLDALSNVRLFSLGGRPEGVQMSKHHSAWLTTVAGAKLWHLAPPSRPKPADRFCRGRGKIDYGLARREGVLHCMAMPGETVVVPDNWWHATCNMLPYTLAVGGQTWDAAVQVRFAARDEAAAAATAERWRQGLPRTLNEFQALVLAWGLADGERIPNT